MHTNIYIYIIVISISISSMIFILNNDERDLLLLARPPHLQSEFSNKYQ